MSGLVGIGRKPERDASVAGRLRDCHGRIRAMLALAARIADEPAATDEVAEAAGRVHRYFAVSLPLHLLDEEESIKPRLPAAQALELMSMQHVEHERLLAPLLAHWAALRAGGGDRQALRAELRALAADLEAHLQLEERDVFPAVARLPPDAQAAIIAEMEARRA
jgi:hypothetical protein